MSTLIPVGQVRYDFQSDQKQVWDGVKWNTISDDEFTELPIYQSAVANGGHTITTSVPTSTISTVVNSINDSRKEDIFHYIMKNLRVAEYLTEDGKVDYVQLEMREGDGCNWENIQRVRIKP